MIDYDKIIEQWNNSVCRYCEVHNIPSMDLKNLRQGDVYNYDLYSAYKNVERAVAAYRKTPSSPVYKRELLECLKKWYNLISGPRSLLELVLPSSRVVETWARAIKRMK